MIISASRRTDIPAFFSRWFLERLKAGFCYVRNPFNPSLVRRYSLLPEDVEVIVFWSKNPLPLISHLDFLDSRGYRYYFQFTLNGYPKVFEPCVPPVEERIKTFKKLSRLIGKARVIWRYDPIILSSVTPVQYHLDRVRKIAKALKGYTERLVISFLDFYGKVKARLEKLSQETRIVFYDPLGDGKEEMALETCDEVLKLAQGIADIAISSGMEVFSCAETVDLRPAGIRPGACIDADLIYRLFDIDRPMNKDKGQRPECRCVESVDIGAYNTCLHRCSYCYANYSFISIKNNLKKHIPTSPLLIGTYDDGFFLHP